MKKYQDLWDNILEELSKNYSEDIFNEIFGETKSVIKYTNGLVYVLVPSVYIQTKINYTYSQKIKNIVDSLIDEPIKFKFVTAEEAVTPQNKYVETKVTKKVYDSYLNENYNFESFVVGESNRFSIRSAMMVAEQPGQFANPLYIFGGVGLGKTHLMQAIGNYVIEKDINKKVLYIQAQNFIVDYSKATQSGNMESFEQKYNELDVLLVDDIQMLEIGKKSQQEFFKLFCDMHDSGKQIVITSDCPADQLKGIMDRLTSRFSWGMTVNISQPNLEHRVNILKRKLIESPDANKDIDDEIYEYIANQYINNIRELEGAFRRVLYYGVMLNQDITLPLVKEALEPLLKNRKKDGTEDKFENLKSIIASFYQISVEDLISKKRTNNLIVPRHICMYLLKKKYDLPYKKIGNLLGNRDHSTVMSGYKKIEQDLKTNKEIKLAIDTISKKIE